MTRIGLDYGGVISFAPDGWADTIRKAQSRGHQIYLISHATKGGDMQIRTDFCNELGITNLSFDHLGHSHQKEICELKADLCQEYGIEIFIDDDLHRVEEVGRECERCAALYIPQNLWQLGQRLVDGMGED